MKAEFDNEIDALLRRNARAARGVARDGGERHAQATAHLDADELSAFAENALPAAARMSAASHLADCDECRGVVVKLSGAAGDVGKRAAVDPSEAQPRVGARGWLASLLSPRALRFVAPALALCLLGALALVVLRTGREDAGNTVAMRGEERDAARPNAAPAAPDAGANANTNASIATGTLDANANAPETPGQTAAPAAPVTSGPSVAASDDDSPDGSQSRATDERSVSPAPEAVLRDEAVAPPPPPRPAAAAAPVGSAAAPVAQPPAPREAPKEDARAQAEEGEAARNENQSAEKRGAQAENQQTPDGANKRPATPAYGGGARAGTAAPRHEPERRNRSLGGPLARRAPGEDAARDRADADAAGETRSVAGRRFRREGGAWVDVNYRPTMSMTGVRRGTESYRALVADHPELGRIAEQLGGEVITVIGGRAYRIR